VEGYYVVFDHRQNPKPQRENQKVGDVEFRVTSFLWYKNRPHQFRQEAMQGTEHTEERIGP